MSRASLPLPLPARGWLAAHGARPGLLAALVLGPALAALLARWPLPHTPPADVTVDPTLNPAHLGLLALALAVGLLPVLLVDRLAWATDVAARPVRRMRCGWVLLPLAAQGLGAVLGAPLLPAHLSAGAAWLSCLPLLWGLCLLGDVLLGPLAGTLLPAAVVAALGFGPLPWHVDVLFNPDLQGQRLLVGCALAVLGAALYALRGTRRGRGVVAAAD
ncbi:hypothetical protein [Micrococcus lylae]|uniref:Integral membrane protein n=1 Tax=Micrococcus lylae TaxID=1273 RepID=A0ABY2JYJ6_9MICC|nr:hypothetical protein [Micrococcus lylae]TFH98168.1 hypothetical protein E4A49_09830 [Micrococcus lylae]